MSDTSKNNQHLTKKNLNKKNDKVDNKTKSPKMKAKIMKKQKINPKKKDLLLIDPKPSLETSST